MLGVPRIAQRIPALLIGALASFSGCSSAPHSGTKQEADVSRRAAHYYLDAQLAGDRSGGVYAAAIARDEFGDRVFVAASSNTGEAWRSPVMLAHDAPGARRAPRLATGSSGEVYAVWPDTRAGVANVYFNCSLDGGATWLPEDLRINTNVAAGSHLAAPNIAADDHGNVYVVWMDDREGFEAYYCNRSRDSGRTWLPLDRRVTPLGFGRKGIPRLACDLDGTVHVVWVEERNGRRGLFANVSSDHGETWLLTDATIAFGTETLTPEIATLDGGIAIVTWLEPQGRRGQVLAAVTNDRGRSWSGPRALGGSSADWISTPRIATVRPALAYIAWHEQGRGGQSAIVLQSSQNGGARFGGIALEYLAGRGPLPLDPASAGRAAPFTMSADMGGNVYFAYVENQPGQWSVAFDRVTDFGRNWLRLQSRLDLTLPATIAIAAGLPRDQLPAVTTDDLGHVCVLWNTGDALWLASSPFNGDSGWRQTSF